ncbi:two-component system histidine kinase PnpS [Lederbergia graminis]|uniref:histidine kinase n=1 Tax=Lederbergia graminis TaxID=735518 RepID=A0ABW0LLM8_9BACI
MHKLWLRITFSFLILMSLLLFISGFFLADMMKDTYYKVKENQLTQVAELAINAIDIDQQQMSNLQNEVELLTQDVNVRISIINKDGVVLADSEEDPVEMTNHRDRPEVKQILDDGQVSGLSTRYSETLGYSMMYVTIPIMNEDELVGVMRTSLTLDTIKPAVRKMWGSVALILFAALLLTGLIGMRLAKDITEPIEDMIQVSEQLKDNDYSARVKTAAKGELRQLANAINVLASSLQNQMIEIKENEQRLSGVLANMMSGVILVNVEGRIVLANKAIGSMLGRNSESLIGQMHVEAGRNASLSNLIEQSLKTKKEIRDEIHFYYPKERILDVHLAPFVGENGDMRGIIVVLHDVTDVRRLEKMRSDFVANVSHELKTPITSVKGFAETLLDGAMEDTELCRSFIEIIYKESDRLHRLIKDILYLSGIEHHRVPLISDQVNMVNAINAAVDMVKNAAAKKNIQLHLPPQENIVIEGEKDRIHQIILNLLSNAIAYTPEGGKVTVTLSATESKIKFGIADTGIGIAQAEISRIFERFYRVDKARSRNSGGTGLGLAIVKHLVDSHNGTIEVDSMEGEGTTFTVTLPIKQEYI